MSNSSEDCTKLPDKGNIQASQAMYTKKSIDVCFSLVWCTVILITAATALTLCSAFGVLDLRLPWFSNHSSVDSQEGACVLGQFLPNTEMEKLLQKNIGLEAEIQALKQQMLDNTRQMDALRLQASKMQAKANETASMVSSLMDQNDEVSLNFVKINATEKKMAEQYSAVVSEMEAVKLNVSNIYAKENKTASMVSTWIEQVETLKFHVSTIDAKQDALSVNVWTMNSTMEALKLEVLNIHAKLNETASTTSALTTQLNKTASTTSALTNQLNKTASTTSALTNQWNKTASTTSALTTQRPRTSSSNQRVTACNTIAAVAFIVLLALLL